MCMACTALFIHALGNVSHNHTADKKRRNKCNQINLNKEMFFLLLALQKVHIVTLGNAKKTNVNNSFFFVLSKREKTKARQWLIESRCALCSPRHTVYLKVRNDITIVQIDLVRNRTVFVVVIWKQSGNWKRATNQE